MEIDESEYDTPVVMESRFGAFTVVAALDADGAIYQHGTMVGDVPRVELNDAFISFDIYFHNDAKTTADSLAKDIKNAREMVNDYHHTYIENIAEAISEMDDDEKIFDTIDEETLDELEPDSETVK